MSRGKIIFPFVLTIGQLDTEATAADPDGAGPLTSGYDDIFREPVAVPTPGDQDGVVAREENVITVRGQFEPGDVEIQNNMLSGNSPEGQLIAWVHFSELQLNGLLDDNGQAMIRNNDRLIQIDTVDGLFVQSFPDPPGMYAITVSPRGWGLGNPARRNLLKIIFEPRLQSVRG